MTENELSDYLNYSAEIKLFNREPFKGIIQRASEFERENTKYVYIKNNDMIEWNKKKREKNRSELLQYQNDVEISEIEWMRQIKK